METPLVTLFITLFRLLPTMDGTWSANVQKKEMSRSMHSISNPEIQFNSPMPPHRKWILMTGGDAGTETNHIFLLDIADLNSTRGIPEVE